MINVISNTFKKEVIQSDKPVVVDFWATWCGPCKMLTPILTDISKELVGVKFVKVNVDENIGIASQYHITSVPTILIFKGGEVIDKFTGFKPKEQIISFIKKQL